MSDRIKLALTKKINGVSVEYGRVPEENLSFYFRTRDLYDKDKFTDIIDKFTNKIIDQESDVQHGCEWVIERCRILDWNEHLQTVIVGFYIKDSY